MTRLADVQTVTDPRGGWINKQNGAQVGVVYDTEHDAVEAGGRLARESRSEHFVHGPDGSILPISGTPSQYAEVAIPPSP